MKTFKNYQNALNNTGQQLTAQQLLNGRVYTKNKGWAKVQLSEEFREQVITDIVDLLGGRGNTKANVYRALNSPHPPQHWTLERMLIEQYGKSAPRLSYCAGQDYPYEINQGRTYLKNI